jgi:hypothetical protein
MFDYANCPVPRGFNPSRYARPLVARRRFASDRAPEYFCFSWPSRHLKVNYSSVPTKTSCAQVEVSA